MNRSVTWAIAIFVVLALAGQTSAAPTWDENPEAFVHGIALEIDGETWYFAGPGSMPDKIDVPGHTWVRTGPDRVVGRHYNVGPSGAASWWANDEPDGVLLYKVDGIIAPLPGIIDSTYLAHLKKIGYIHIHELVKSDGTQNTEMGVYLKHTAVRKFYFNSLPMPGAAHEVTQGIDFEFMPNLNNG